MIRNVFSHSVTLNFKIYPYIYIIVTDEATTDQGTYKLHLFSSNWFLRISIVFSLGMLHMY